MQRGVISNRARAAQLRDFSGLRYGTITPTDYDLVIEYHNRCWIYAELKHSGTPVPFGQRLALERQCDDLHRVKKTLVAIASHNTDADIDAANCIVTEYRYDGKWVRPNEETTLKQLIDRFINYVDSQEPF